jgi:hypothetical protein
MQSIRSELSSTLQPIRIPEAPPAVVRGLFRWPGMFEISVQFVNPPAEQRAAFVPFTSSEEYSGKERPYEFGN